MNAPHSVKYCFAKINLKKLYGKKSFLVMPLKVSF